MARIDNTKLWLLIVVCLPIALLCWCLKHYCRDEEEEFVPEPSSPMITPSAHRWGNIENHNSTPPRSPNFQRTTVTEFEEDLSETSNLNGYTAPYPLVAFNQIPSRTDNLTDTMPELLSTNSVTIYPLPSTTPSVPSDDPPSYAEAMRNT